MNTVNVYLAIIVILVIALLLSFRLSAMLARRAVCRVVAIFRENQAIDSQKALPLDTLGLGPRPLLSFRLLHDYKPWALQTLVQAGVIRKAGEETFYLSEETLKVNEYITSACQIQ
jgi:hypothetical protein